MHIQVGDIFSACFLSHSIITFLTLCLVSSHTHTSFSLSLPPTLRPSSFPLLYIQEYKKHNNTILVHYDTHSVLSITQDKACVQTPYIQTQRHGKEHPHTYTYPNTDSNSLSHINTSLMGRASPLPFTSRATEASRQIASLTTEPRNHIAQLCISLISCKESRTHRDRGTIASYHYKHTYMYLQG